MKMTPPNVCCRSEVEELAELEALKRENRQLVSSKKALEEQCLMQEEALSQEQTERREQERKLKDEIAKLEILFTFAFLITKHLVE